MFSHEPDYEFRFFGATARWSGGGLLVGVFWVVAALAMGLAIAAGIAWLITWAINDIIDHGVMFRPVLALTVAAHYLFIQGR